MALIEVVNVTKQYANGEETITPLNEVNLGREGRTWFVNGSQWIR